MFAKSGVNDPWNAIFYHEYLQPQKNIGIGIFWKQAFNVNISIIQNSVNLTNFDFFLKNVNFGQFDLGILDQRNDLSIKSKSTRLIWNFDIVIQFRSYQKGLLFDQNWLTQLDYGKILCWAFSIWNWKFIFKIVL